MAEEKWLPSSCDDDFEIPSAIAEEIEMLRGIFGSSNITITCGADKQVVVSVRFLSGQHTEVLYDYTLQFAIEKNYPNAHPPMRLELVGPLHSKMPYISSDLHQQLEQDIFSVYRDCPVLLVSVQWLFDRIAVIERREYERLEAAQVTRLHPVPGRLDSEGHPEFFITAEDIVTGASVCVQKSTFIGHATRVRSMQQVNAVVRYFRHVNPATRDATHPAIYAARFGTTTSGMIQEEIDDDGEAHASGRLLFLLRRLELVGWMVVVTRWFGGVLLGPPRFRYIQEAAQNALRAIGAVGA